MAAGGGYGKLLEDRPPNPVILEAQKYVRDRLEKKWLPLFLATPEFAERQKPKAGMDDVVDDVLVQKKKKSQSVMRVCNQLLVLNLFPTNHHYLFIEFFGWEIMRWHVIT